MDRLRLGLARASAVALAGLAMACGSPSDPPKGVAIAVDYCAVETAGTKVEVVRPGADAEAPIDDVNWFARPVPTESGDWVIAFASHNQNYLYDLANDRRIAIPDASDAVATPDGRYITVPSHYTPDHRINFYANSEFWPISTPARTPAG